MANSTKITKRDNFAMVRKVVETSNVVNKADLLAFIDKEVTQLAKKNTSKTSQENIERMNAIKDVLRENGVAMTCTEIMNKVGFSSQRTAALLRMMGEDGTKEVVRTMDKKKAYFSLV